MYIYEYVRGRELVSGLSGVAAEAAWVPSPEVLYGFVVGDGGL